MTLRQVASIGPSALNTREGLSFLIGYAKHVGIDTLDGAVHAVHVDCIILCSTSAIFTEDPDVIDDVLQIADIDF